MRLLLGWMVVAFLIQGCVSHTEKTDKGMELLAQKNYPYDQFYMRRAFPDKHFPVRAYMDALKEVQLEGLSESPNEFDGAWTIQGPGNLGARINTVAAVPNSSTIYVGFANGGVWKTYNGGDDWFPIFDEQLFLTIGEITIDPNDTSTVYVGTGDPNITSYPAIGNGVFKSTNGGATWAYLGLSETATTSRIIVNPNNSNQIFVATMGLPFERNTDRGLYRSDDGGQTWQQILYLADQAGVVDLVMNPNNPSELYAVGWDRLRNNFESIVYGPNAKVMKTTDGGDNWTELTNGLPQGTTCRPGIAMCESQPNVLYVLRIGTDFQAEGVYKSVDGGASWVSKGANGLSSALGGFGWYFGQIRVDPVNPDLLYILGVYTWRSTDGGDTWQRFVSNPGHPDKHDLVFYDGGMLITTDGGVYRSVDNAETLTRIDNIPANEVYRTGYNPFRPDEYYAGCQDNGTSAGSSSAINNWQIFYGGDGFQTRFDPVDPNVYYAEAQIGEIGRTTDGGQYFYSMTSGKFSADRKSWDLPYMISNFHHKTLYLGTHKVYEYDTTQQNFVALSGDLTDGNIYGNIFHSISTIDESYFVDKELYVGTTDANVYRRATNDNWVNITAGLPERYVTSVKASPSQSGRIFVTHSGYRDNDFIPRVHRSDDFGATWVDISSNLPNIAVNDILVIPNQQDSLLVVATDGGVYATLNAGDSWQRVGGNMPYIKVMDLEYNVVNNQIVAATFGRSVMTYPLEELNNNGSMEIVGTIQTVTGHDVPAHIALIKPNGDTTVSADFHFVGLSPVGPYRLAPKLNTQANESVNVIDLLLMYQHILGYVPFSSDQEIAGDIDQSGDIAIGDLLLLRKLTLGIIDEYPNNQSWRFYADTAVYQTEENHYGAGNAVRINSLPANSVHFKGIKVGDVNQSWGE